MPPPGPRRRGAAGLWETARARWAAGSGDDVPSRLPPPVSRDSMKTAEDARGVHGEGPRKLGLCLLCGLPAAGKSTFARALSPRLRQERGWAVGVVAYDDVMPDAVLEEASARPLVSTEGAGPSLWSQKDIEGLHLNAGLSLVWEVRP